MTKTKLLTWFSVGLLLLTGCDPEMKKDDKYARPDWLEGKVYTQLLEQSDLSTFARCVELSGYDTIIDRSGSYTVFAPNNEAMAVWLQANGYAQVEDIPEEENLNLVKYHLVQNPWTKDQLQELDVWGWIDTLDVNNDKPRGYKRETLLIPDDRKLGVKIDANDEEVRIVDTLSSSWYRVYMADSRKYTPIFFKDYFDIYNLKSTDYEYYFDRPIEGPNDLYYAGGKVLGDEIFAENGFIYEIDRVVEPLQNAYEILESEEEGNNYGEFLSLLNRFPEFRYNEDKTFDQEGADQGAAVDSLFSMSYPDLAFDILNERTTAPRGSFGLPYNVTIRYHHGVAAPSDAALSQLENDYLAGFGKWGSLEQAPYHIKRIVANTHLSTNPIYPTDFENGFINGEDDRVWIDQANVIQKQYGSNATFVGLDKAIVPRAFKAVTGPVYQQRGFSFSMYAIEQAGLLSALKREERDYMLFVESDIDCQADSSLLYSYNDETFNLYQGSGSDAQVNPLDVNELRTLILNHVGTSNPRGVARKEFVKNLAGNYLVVDNLTGEVRGTAPTTERYQGELVVHEIPELISDNADNGNTFKIENWFSFTATNLYLQVSANFPSFHNLLKKAGLSVDAEYRYTFLSENENYTIFAPTDQALLDVEADTLSIPDLKKFLMLHFVQGGLIFTDGTAVPGYYETTRIDDASTQFNTIFSRIYLDPGIDQISLTDKTGGNYVTVAESPLTNLMAGRDVGEGDEIFPVVVINSVIHQTEKALIFDELDSK